MDIYELLSGIDSSRLDHHCDILVFNQSNRSKLESDSELEKFDLFKKAYEIMILFRSDRGESESGLEYRKYGGEGVTPFTDYELNLFNSLDWTRLPHNLKAHINDVIWICNRRAEAARSAAEEYFLLYHERFDEVHWVECVDFINRAIEIAAKIGDKGKKNDYLTVVYNDIVRLNGEDSSFLSISLIELLVSQKYRCDYNTLIPFLDKLIAKNSGSVNTVLIVEQAYYAKANLYKMLKDTVSENSVYVQYADALLNGVNNYLNATNSEGTIDNRNWFMAENDIKEAIRLFQNHGASEKAAIAQKRLVEIQNKAIKHISMHEFKCDVSEYYKRFCTEHEDHDVNELIRDAVFSFEFQNKQKIREEITKNNSSLWSLFPMQMIGSEGQTEFLLPALDLEDENNILLHMYHKAKEKETISGQTVGSWFIQFFQKRNLQEADLDFIFKNNPIIPPGQEKDVQRGVYFGLTGHMSDALDKLAPKLENIIRHLAEMCGDNMTYYDFKEGVQQKKVLSQVFIGEKLNECVEENIIFTFDGLLQQKAGSNIRNIIGHGLNTEAECCTGDCIYFVMIVMKFCALYCAEFKHEFFNRKHT